MSGSGLLYMCPEWCIHAVETEILSSLFKSVDCVGWVWGFPFWSFSVLFCSFLPFQPSACMRQEGYGSHSVCLCVGVVLCVCVCVC